MKINKIAAQVASTCTASKSTFDSCNHTGTDSLIGWFNLAKPSRNRQQKRSWKLGEQRGRMDAYLAGQLALLGLIALLLVSGVML